MESNPVIKASEVVGGQAKLAAALGVSAGMVSQWSIGHRRVAAEHCPAIERATGGAVRCEDLRPDIDWAVLRSSDCCPQHKEAARMALQVHKGSTGFFLHCPGKEWVELRNIEPPPCAWFCDQSGAEAEAVRLAEITGLAFLVVRVISKCVPWHCLAENHKEAA